MTEEKVATWEDGDPFLGDRAGGWYTLTPPYMGRGGPGIIRTPKRSEVESWGYRVIGGPKEPPSLPPKPTSPAVLECMLREAQAQLEAAGRALEEIAPGLLAEQNGSIFEAILNLNSVWQPIDTAPRYLEVLVRYELSYGPGYCGAVWINGQWWSNGQRITPTHWTSFPRFSRSCAR
jgi:hypothetical protein